MKNFILKLLLIAIFLTSGIIAFAQEQKDSTNLDSIYNQMKEEFVLANFDFEFDFDDDNVSSTQTLSWLLSSNGDVFSRQANFSFSPLRFRLRGYNAEYQKTYMNGIYFNGLERGNFNFSSIGGLNYATRNKEVTRGMESNSYTFGNIGTSTNVDVRASSFAKGHNLSFALTNRSYVTRLQYTYATGLMQNGWAFMGSVVGRWADLGLQQSNFFKEGLMYKSVGYFLSAEKQITPKHIIYFSTFGAPTERTTQSAVTKEVTDLIGSIYYNPWWGLQNGKIRNSRVVHSYDPTALLNYEWKISENQNLKLGAAFHYSWYSNTAFGYADAPSPDPTYYRNLPSYMNDGHFIDGLDDYDNPTVVLDADHVDIEGQNRLADLWRSRNLNTTQTNWDAFYLANYNSTSGLMRYMLERRHNNLMETSFNANYKNVLNDKLKLTAGIEAKYAKGIHYKTVDDMLGAEKWLDKDVFAERDMEDETKFPGDISPDYIYNNLDKKDAVIRQGDKFGYDYDINITHLAAYVQNDWNFRNLELYYALQGTYTQFYRFGRMENGRAKMLSDMLGTDIISKGAGKVKQFIDPAFKAGVTWKINSRNIIQVNAMGQTQAPLAYSAYVSPKIRDTQVKNLVSEKVLTADLSYNFSFPKVMGRISAFYTNMFDALEFSSYYDDEYRTLINCSMSGVNKQLYGVEAGISVKLNKYLTLIAAGTYADYSYTKNAHLTMSSENGTDITGKNFTGETIDVETAAMIKGLKVAAGPQVAGNLSLKFFHPKMWFAEVTVNYFDKNYFSFAPSHYTEDLYGNGIEGDPLQWGATWNESWLNSDGKPIGANFNNEIVSYGEDLPIHNNSGKVVRNEPSEARKILGTQEKINTEWKSKFLLDLSIGKLIYLKNRKSISINLSVNNLLNSKIISGGYQQGRVPKVTAKDQKGRNLKDAEGNDVFVLSKNYNKFPSKYYYANGINFYFNIGFKF